MNLIEQNRYYKTDIFIDINGNIYKNKIFKIENGHVKFFEKVEKKEIIELNSIVFPSFVNAHTHLELTNINKSDLNFSSFVDWVISLIKEKRKKDEKFFLNSYLKGKNLLNNYGIYAFGNILSPFLYDKIPENDKEFNFIEIIEYNKNNIENINLNYPKVSPHSFFSVHPDLIEKILKLNKPISIHFFESKEEYEYLIHNRGDIPEKLYSFTNLKPLKYNLDYFLKFLKKVQNVQLVHLCNLPEDLKPLIIKRKNELHFTLCPRSNKKFGLKSPYYFFIKNNIPFSLGTDSLCSNDDLNIVNEAKFIFEDLKDEFDKEQLAKILFLCLTKWGYKSIFSNNVNYIYITNFTSHNNFYFCDFLEHHSIINKN